jgi:hypothetical protein
MKRGRLGELKKLIWPKKISDLGDIRNLGEIVDGAAPENSLFHATSFAHD